MKKNSKLSNLYLGLVFLLMYLPILVVIVFSFNDSRLTVGWKGFSLQWYEKLFQNSSLMEALGNSLILGVLSCLLSAVIGTLGAVDGEAQLQKQRTFGICVYSAAYDAGDYSGHGVSGVFLSVEPAFWNADAFDFTHGVLCPVYPDGSKSTARGNGQFFRGGSDGLGGYAQKNLF